MKRLLRLAGLSAAALLLIPAVIAGAVTTGMLQLPPDATPSRTALADIPADLLPLYQQAAAGCPGLSWTVLAAIGKVESNHNRPPRQVSSAGARGPMQFLPATWDVYGLDGDGDGTADPFTPADAILSAAQYLCALGADRDTPTAVTAYTCGSIPNCRVTANTDGGYTRRVLAWASGYSDPLTPRSSAAQVAVQVALAQVGTPYLWGGETPGVGFDCSGLVQYAYGTAGLTLPRTAQTQYDHGPRLPTGASVAPGDLLFFGTSTAHVTHVGIALGQGRMVDAPHTGALVRVEPIAGFRNYLGATRPTAGTGRSA